MTLRIATITIDCADPPALARWWADALGWSITYDSPDEVVIEAPEGETASPLLFIKVPDDKVVKNRLHLDLRRGRPRRRSREAGGTRSAARGHRPGAGRHLGRDGRPGEQRVLRPESAPAGRAYGQLTLN